MTSGAHLRFFTTAAHPCSYLPESDAITLFADPEADMSPAIFSQLSVLGFRRSGNYVYRPHCMHCQACISVRVPVAQFKPDRSQRRCERLSQDISTRIVNAEWSESHYALYARYIEARHQTGDMYPPSPRQYREFLTSDWSDSFFIEFYWQERLVAVAVTDELDDGLSAVYTFYEPDLEARSLGTFAILSQIKLSQLRGLRYLYLGYWVKQSPRMSYKTRFRPLQLLVKGEWLLAR